MKIFAVGACCHAYVAIRALSLSFSQSAASQSVRVAVTIEILFGRTYEIWGMKIASEAITHLASKIKKNSWGRIHPGPHHLEIACMCPCLVILQIHSDTFVDLDKV